MLETWTLYTVLILYVLTLHQTLRILRAELYLPCLLHPEDHGAVHQGEAGVIQAGHAANKAKMLANFRN